MNCTKTEQDDAVCLKVRGDLMIQDVAELHSDILSALACRNAVKIDLRDVSAIDTAATQLLLSAARSAGSLGGRISLENGSELLASSALRLGLDLAELSQQQPGGN